MSDEEGPDPAESGPGRPESLASRQRPWRPEKRNVRALDRWIREHYGNDAPLYGGTA